MNSKALSRLTFHGFVTIIYFCALVRYEYLPPMPHKSSRDHYAGSWKYLTYWNLIAQFLFFVLSCIIDLLKSSSSHYNKLTRLRDKFYASIALPFGIFVFGVFWVLYLIDRELIFPRVLDGVFPAWLNHVSHTVIVPVLLMETYILKHRHPRRKDGIVITSVFGLTYIIWVLYLALVMDIWPYPVLQIMNWGQRCAFFGFGALCALFMYYLGERINSCCWGTSAVQKVK